MTGCLAEGARELDRAFLQQASSITLMQDVRAGKLLIRFRAALPDLTVRRGIIAQVAVPEGGGKALAKATGTVWISDSFTPSSIFRLIV